jgi:ParB family chromosome partitioning protein
MVSRVEALRQMTNTKSKPAAQAVFDPIAAGKEIDALADQQAAARGEVERTCSLLMAKLVEAHDSVPDFKAFIETHTHISRQWAYELLNEARGIVTADERRAKTAKRVREHRANKECLLQANVTDTNVVPFKHPNAFSMGTGGGDEWFTPVKYLELVCEVLGGVDTCPASNAFAQQRFDFGGATHFTKDDDALTKPWRGRVWLNPPFSKGLMSAFVDKLIAEYSAGRVTAAILLTNTFTANGWFQKAGNAATAVCLLRKRIQFEREGSGTPGKQIYGQAMFFFGADAAPFIQTFRPHGICLVRP